MRPPRLEPDAQQRVLGQQLDDARSASPRRAACPCRASAAAGRCGRARSAPRCARAATAACRARARGTPARACALADERLQPRVRLLRLRDDHQPRRVAVEPVHDARAAPPRRPRATPTSAWTSVPVACPRAGWTTSPAGLSTTSRCSSSYASRSSSSSRCERLRRRRRLELHLLPALQPPRLRARDAVDVHARVDRALGRGARADVRRDERVESRARGVVRNANAQGDLRRRARAAGCRRRRR